MKEKKLRSKYIVFFMMISVGYWVLGVVEDPRLNPHTSHLHITLARIPEVAPVYARQLLENEMVSSTVLSPPLVLRGTVKRVTR